MDIDFNKVEEDKGTDRASNPWPVPSKRSTELFENNIISSKKGKNRSDTRSSYSAPTYSSSQSRSSKPQKEINQEIHKCKELKCCTTGSFATKARLVNPKQSKDSKGLSSPQKHFSRKATEGSYYSAYTYGKKPTSILDIIFDDDTPSPRGLTRDKEAIQKSLRRPSIHSEKNNATKSEKQMRFPLRRSIIPTSEPQDTTSMSEIMKIETRRTIVREGGVKFEEISIIQFPQNLPQNVRVITAQCIPGKQL